jgi:hypothetical protein
MIRRDTRARCAGSRISSDTAGNTKRPQKQAAQTKTGETQPGGDQAPTPAQAIKHGHSSVRAHRVGRDGPAPRRPPPHPICRSTCRKTARPSGQAVRGCGRGLRGILSELHLDGDAFFPTVRALSRATPRQTRRPAHPENARSAQAKAPRSTPPTPRIHRRQSVPPLRPRQRWLSRARRPRPPHCVCHRAQWNTRQPRRCAPTAQTPSETAAAAESGRTEAGASGERRRNATQKPGEHHRRPAGTSRPPGRQGAPSGRPDGASWPACLTAPALAERTQPADAQDRMPTPATRPECPNHRHTQPIPESPIRTSHATQQEPTALKLIRFTTETTLTLDLFRFRFVILYFNSEQLPHPRPPRNGCITPHQTQAETNIRPSRPRTPPSGAPDSPPGAPGARTHPPDQ